MGRPKELTEEEKERLRRRGFRPVEVWVLDVNNPKVQAMIREEGEAIRRADQADDIEAFLDYANEAMWDELDK
jgi:uroporphyrinogen-III synthase